MESSSTRSIRSLAVAACFFFAAYALAASADAGELISAPGGIHWRLSELVSPFSPFGRLSEVPAQRGDAALDLPIEATGVGSLALLALAALSLAGVIYRRRSGDR